MSTRDAKDCSNLLQQMLGHHHPRGGVGMSNSWTGNGDGFHWEDGDNWEDGVPQSDDVVELNGEFGIGAGSVTVRELQVLGAVSINAEQIVADKIIFSGASRTVVGTILKANNEFHWSEGELNGPLQVPAGAQLFLEGTAAKTLGGDLLNAGTMHWQEGDLNVSGTISNSGTILMETSAVLVDATTLPGGGLVITNSGKIILSPNQKLVIFGGLSSTGLLELSGGTIELRDGGNHALIGATVKGPGTLRVISAPPVCNSFLGCGKTVTLSDNAILELSVFGSLGGAPEETVTFNEGGIRWTGGRMEDLLRLGPAVSLTVEGLDDKELGGTLINEGTLVCRGGGGVDMSNGQLDNRGELRVEGYTGISNGSISNSGNMRFSVAGEGMKLTEAEITSRGVLELGLSTLTLSENSSCTLEAGSVLRVSLEKHLMDWTYGRIGGNGNVTLTGPLEIHIGEDISGPGPVQPIELIRCSCLLGEFSAISPVGAYLDYTGKTASLFSTDPRLVPTRPDHVQLLGSDGNPRDLIWYSQYDGAHVDRPGDAACARACIAMLKPYGVTSKPSVLKTAHQEDDTANLILSAEERENQKALIAYIDSELIQYKRPVAVGVTWRKGGDDTDNPDGVTDHYVVIYDVAPRGSRSVYLFRDPGTKIPANSYGEFYFNEAEGFLVKDAKPPDPGTEKHCYNYRYEVTCVRPNDPWTQ
jgi:hypothetical protein